MTESERALLVHSLLAGVKPVDVNGTLYLLKNPDRDIRLRADLLYNSILRSNAFEDMLRTDSAKAILIMNRTITPNFEKELKELNDNLDEAKVTLFKAYLASQKDKDKIRRQIKQIKDRMQQKLEQRHSLDHFTLEGFAQHIRSRYLIKKCTDVNIEDERLIDALLHAKYECEPTLENLREIARNEPWISYWRVGKEKIFSVPYADLSSEQKHLALLSKMYDNAYQDPDCPADEIIEDDDMFDGWMIDAKRKREQERTSRSIDDVLGKQADKHDIFIPVSDKEQADKINNLNSLEAQIVKKQREKIIELQGKVDEADLPDIKLERFTAENRAAAEHIKRTTK